MTDTVYLDAMAWRTAAGLDKARSMCAEAGTDYNYYKHICNFKKRPSADLARRMVEASSRARVYSNGKLAVLGFDQLLFPKEKMRGVRKATVTAPAKPARKRARASTARA